MDDVELSSVVCITVSCIVTTGNEVSTSGVVVVELCEGPLNDDEVLSTWLEDLEAAGLLPDRFDCLGSCDAFFDFSSAFFLANSSLSFSFQAFLASFFLFLLFPYLPFHAKLLNLLHLSELLCRSP